MNTPRGSNRLEPFNYTRTHFYLRKYWNPSLRNPKQQFFNRHMNYELYITTNLNTMHSSVETDPSPPSLPLHMNE